MRSSIPKSRKTNAKSKFLFAHRTLILFGVVVVGWMLFSVAILQYHKHRGKVMQQILEKRWGSDSRQSFFGSYEHGSTIRGLHHQLQRECGHRGVGRDRKHLDNRKGPSVEATYLFRELNKAYEKARKEGYLFEPPKQVENGKAVWRDLEFSCFSQCGDDGVIQRIFGVLGPGRRLSAEIGYFPHEANTVLLLALGGFRGLLLDGGTDELIARSWFADTDAYLGILHAQHALPERNRTIRSPTAKDLRARCAPFCLDSCYNLHCAQAEVSLRPPEIRRAMVTTGNVASLLADAFLPDAVLGPGGLDLLSVDIDGMEYYLLRTLLHAGARPRVVISEFASHLGQSLGLARGYADDFYAAGNSWQYGASIVALTRLLARHGYRFIGCVEWNAYFVDLEALRPVPGAAEALPEAGTDSCFYPDDLTWMSERQRLLRALQVEWVEVEPPAAAAPRAWPELRRLLLADARRERLRRAGAGAGGAEDEADLEQEEALLAQEGA